MSDREQFANGLDAAMGRLQGALRRLQDALEAQSQQLGDKSASPGEADQLRRDCLRLQAENDRLSKALEESEATSRRLETKNNTALGRIDAVIGQLRTVLTS
jgi:chromosome segregation ATPase